MGFNEAFQSVKELVNDFKENEKVYLKPDYSEADVRNDFINKFFIALGWDVRHDIQKNPYKQEVRVEKPVHVAKAQKRADYTFYLEPNFRDVKFFVEAKKPFHDLINKDYFFQTIRYGWNANTPVAVLTDFEEFIILDCRFRPDINDILNFKIKNFHYSDYANEEKFREIYYLFSREAVADNSIERYAELLPKPKGKAVQRGLFAGGFQSIDESFLVELDEIRTALAKSFKKNNSHLTSDELTEATQRTIDRLVFIKFLEDKMIEPNHYVSEFGNRKSAWEDFITASITLDAKYNGVVFKKSLIDTKNIIEPDDKTFSSICEELSHENTPYNFDAIPIHILGSIYERFLGKVVNATDKRVTIEEKPEVRKAGGVYYTPQYIVNYIVDNTIGKMIEGKKPKDIAKLCFADIACGSGSFLITVYERLLDYHKRWYSENPEQAKKDGCVLYEGTYRLSLKQKQKILTNNIYGVDLDHQAVEVTQLSLYLKLLEDETTATANDTWVMFKERLLPDLSKNIVCGNSLIGTDILEGNLFDFDEERKLKPMDFETTFPEVMKAGGFDAIVGNPPYGAELNDIIRKYLNDFYKLGNSDTAALMMAKAVSLLNRNGINSFIIPKGFTYASNWTKTREKLIGGITKITDCSKVWSEVKYEMSIYEFNKAKKFDEYDSFVRDGEIFKQTSKVSKKLCDEFGFLINGVSKKEIELASKIISHKNFINDYFVNQRGAMLQQYLDEMGNIKVIGGKQLNRYYLNSEVKGRIERKNIGDPKAYIKPNSILVQNIVAHIMNPIPHISIISTIVDPTYTEELAILDTINQLINKSDLSSYYFLGILNSKLTNWYTYKFIFANAIRTMHFDSIVTERIPLPSLIKEKLELYDIMIKDVKQMLATKKQLQLAKTESDKNYLNRKCERLDKEIDQLVYQLYGLTEEEIKIVEGENS